MVLNWIDNASNETAFRVERSVNGAFQEVLTVGANVTTARVSGLALRLGPRLPGAGQQRRRGLSAYSNTATVTTPSPPDGAGGAGGAHRQALAALGSIRSYLATVAPVLMEPLVKLLLPVAKLVSPGVSPLTRFYLFLDPAGNVAVWAFCGGIITRIAAVQLANKGPITLQAGGPVRRATATSATSARPLVPLVIIARRASSGCSSTALLGLIPFVGDSVLLGLGLPVDHHRRGGDGRVPRRPGRLPADVHRRSPSRATRATRSTP